MGFIQESDVQRLMQDESLMSEIASALVENPDAMEDLADDIADKLDDQMEDNPEVRRQIVDAAMGSASFKKRIVAKLVDDLC